MDGSQGMKGKICLVTGATSGMGEVTARALVRKGASVIIVARSPEKAAATIKGVRIETGKTPEFILADLSSQAEIRRLAGQFKSQHQRLDVLVNNAGAWLTKRHESVDGLEMTFALNHLGQFLLTNLLLDVMKDSAPSRIVNISSYGHARGKIKFDDLQSKRRYHGMQAYRQSKLANILFTYELARRLKGTSVTVNAVNPGLVATNFGLNNFGHNGWLRGFLKRAYRLVAISPEKGAQTAIYLATSTEVKGITGKYFSKQKAVKSSPASYDEAAATRLWEKSAELTGLRG